MRKHADDHAGSTKSDPIVSTPQTDRRERSNDPGVFHTKTQAVHTRRRSDFQMTMRKSALLESGTIYRMRYRMRRAAIMWMTLKPLICKG